MDLFEKVIYYRGNEVMENIPDGMDAEKRKKYKEKRDEIEVLFDKFTSTLKKEQEELFDEIGDILGELTNMRADYIFRAGVMAGLNELSYLKDELKDEEEAGEK